MNDEMNLSDENHDVLGVVTENATANVNDGKVYSRDWSDCLIDLSGRHLLILKSVVMFALTGAVHESRIDGQSLPRLELARLATHCDESGSHPV